MKITRPDVTRPATALTWTVTAEWNGKVITVEYIVSRKTTEMIVYGSETIKPDGNAVRSGEGRRLIGQMSRAAHLAARQDLTAAGWQSDPVDPTMWFAPMSVWSRLLLTTQTGGW